MSVNFFLHLITSQRRHITTDTTYTFNVNLRLNITAGESF